MQRTITQKIRGLPTSDGAGVNLTRLIGSPELNRLDPFLLLDEIRSDDASDYIAGFPPHPHRGFATVTYLLQGKMEHRDHLGNVGLLESGGVQWMTAGRGVIHSEMPQQEDGLLMGFQLWINLPAAEKMQPAHYQDYPPAQIPHTHDDQGIEYRVIAGRIAGIEGPVSAPATEPLMADIRMPAGTAFSTELEKSHNSFIYLYDGELKLGDQTLRKGDLAVLSQGDQLTLQSTADSGFLLLAARPLNEPVARYGPFVMNTREEIEQAIDDYNAGTLTD